jgi:hypothetical protein
MRAVDEVVGGLVEHQHICGQEQHLRQRCARTFAPRKRCDPVARAMRLEQESFQVAANVH